jgi:hypothetical protein
MSEKKRVTLLVDSVAHDDHNVFNFSGGAGSMSAPSSGRDDAPVTSYQCGRKSIVEGVNATELLQMHRKSLADLGTNHSQGDPDQFNGVTLSRRHRASRAEYDSAKDEETQQTLDGFSFGTSE